MGYALFALRKLVVDSELNAAHMYHMQLANIQFHLTAQHAGLTQQMSSVESSMAKQQAGLYSELSRLPKEQMEQKGNNDGEQAVSQKTQIESKIKQNEQMLKTETERINNQIYALTVKENAIELEIKHLDTAVTVLQDQLEAVEQAEGQGIKQAMPKFSGIS